MRGLLCSVVSGLLISPPPQGIGGTEVLQAAQWPYHWGPRLGRHRHGGRKGSQMRDKHSEKCAEQRPLCVSRATSPLRLRIVPHIIQPGPIPPRELQPLECL